MKYFKMILPSGKRRDSQVHAKEVTDELVKRKMPSSSQNVNHQTLTSVKIEPAFFRLLPTEIRDEIYAIVLLKPGPINISSPLSKRRSFFLTDKERFGNIRRVSKRMYEESTFIYCTFNTFAIGNGPPQSNVSPNLKGLQAFTACLPSHNLSLIRNIRLILHCAKLPRNYVEVPTGPTPKYSLGSLIEVSNLFLLGRSISQNLKGLNTIDILISVGYLQYNEKWLISREEEVDFFLRFIREICNETNVQWIRHRHHAGGLQTALKIIKKEIKKNKELKERQMMAIMATESLMENDTEGTVGGDI